jgi:hypothetical protein
LREERVERDPILCEPLNEDVGFFVNLNLRIKSRVSCVLIHLLVLSIIIYLLVEHILFRSSLLGLSLLVSILLVIVLVVLKVGRLSISTFHSLALL